MSDRKSKRLSRMYLEEGEQKKVAAPKDDFVPPPRIGYEDMTKMEDMTLEAVLKNLQDRYEQNQIYVRLSFSRALSCPPALRACNCLAVAGTAGTSVALDERACALRSVTSLQSLLLPHRRVTGV